MFYNNIDFSPLFTFLGAKGRKLSENYTIVTQTMPDADDQIPSRKEAKPKEITARVLIEGNGWDAIKNNIRENISPLLLPPDDLQYVPIIFDDEPALRWMGITAGPVEPIEEHQFYTIAEIPFITKNHVYATSETMIAAVSPYSEISGTINGTCKTKGSIMLDIGATPPSTIIVTGPTGAVVLRAYDTYTLEGIWEIDLQARTVKKDGVLAMAYVDFDVTTFEDFVVGPGSFTISLSEEIDAASYIYRAEYS